MAFQAPVAVQNMIQATIEVWPTMSTVLQAPWKGLGRQASAVGGSSQRRTPAQAQPSAIPRPEAPPSVTLPEALRSVPMSSLFPTPSGAIKSIPTVASTIAGVSHNSLRFCNPMARTMPTSSLMTRRFSTMPHSGGPLFRLRTIPRPGHLGLMIAQQRSLFGGPSQNTLARLEQAANNNPKSASYQVAFYSALLRAGMPQIVVDRHKSGYYATSASVNDMYRKALEKLGRADELHSTNTAMNQSQQEAVARAVGAHVHGADLAKTRGGNGGKSDPLYVVVEESVWAIVFKWVRWLLAFGLAAYMSLIAITLFAESSGVLKKVGGGATAEVRPEHQTTRFSDVLGCDEAKEELQDVVDFLKNPDRYNKLGGRLPKGVLLIGPPGTGKTLLARAVAGEAGVAFFYMSGSEFDEVYVGVGAKRVRQLFTAARAKAPAIVFIDELDAIGGKRQSRDANYHRQTLNQLLNDLDGFDQTTGLIFIAATNHPEILDKALLRPGRFDRHVNVDLPDVRGRMAILKHHTKKIKLAPDADLTTIARATPGFSGAELENLANSAAIRASKLQSAFVTNLDLEWARDKIMMGAERKSKVTPLKDRLHTAYHEGGHTLVGLYTKGSGDIHKATILPRGPAAGITFFLPNEDDHRTLTQLHFDIQVNMGGKMAEEVVYGAENVSTGASSDISQATSLAYNMITRFGMSDKLGNIDYHSNYQSLSPATKEMVDNEVRRVVEEAKNSARTILLRHRKELDLLAQALVQYETLDKEEILKVIKGEKLADRLMAMPDTPIKIPEIPQPIVPGVGSDREGGPPMPPMPPINGASSPS